MKRLCLLLVFWMGLAACSSQDEPSGSGMTELSLSERSSGTIAEVGEVDWYHFNAIEANNVLQINCNGESYNPPVDFLVQVYERDPEGKLVRIWGDHAPEDSALAADIVMNIPITQPRDLYISVRDLMDDEASDQTRYWLALAYTHEAVDNDTFAQATPLGVDDPEGCVSDIINTVGDVDCFGVEINTPGVYNIHSTFEVYDTTPVRLNINVFDDNGDLVYTARRVQETEYDWSLYLETGQYHIVVQDEGRDDADASAPYTLCITSVGVDEAMLNDTPLTAQALSPDSESTVPTYTAEAALAYQQDQDWYAVDVADASGFQTLKLTFIDSVPDGIAAGFEIVIVDPQSEELLVHDHPNGANGYAVQVKVNPGRNLVGIGSADGTTISEALDYELTIEVITVDDLAETDGDGNDTMTTADTLIAPDASVEGKIGFRGDVDWYDITIPDSTDDLVLSIFLTAQDLSLVEYCVDISNGAPLATLSDTNGLDAPTQLKTSYFVPSESEDRHFYIRVGDCQGDDGDDVAYELRVKTDSVPATVAPHGTDTTIYSSESDEFDQSASPDHDAAAFATAAAIQVECAIYPQYDPEFKANNQVLKVGELDGNNQWTSDWIAGFVDYQGDQDWYVLDIQPKHPLGDSNIMIPENWFYDIQIQFYSPGGDVEFTWKLYRDRVTANGIVVERTPGTDGLLNVDDRDGIMAAWAMDLVTSPMVVTETTPAPGVDFWIGDAWQNDRFYLSISDFNYIFTDGRQLRTVPDDDWGYDDARYYFQVTLTYHPDYSTPAEERAALE